MYCNPSIWLGVPRGPYFCEPPLVLATDDPPLTNNNAPYGGPQIKGPIWGILITRIIILYGVPPFMKTTISLASILLTCGNGRIQLGCPVSFRGSGIEVSFRNSVFSFLHASNSHLNYFTIMVISTQAHIS